MADVVTERLREFLPRIEAANGMLGEEGLTLEDVGEGEEYVEMVSAWRVLIVESWTWSFGREEG
jgi:hypothetical protein